MQFCILTSKAIMMTSRFNGQISYEIISPTHTLSKYEKNLAFLVHPNGHFIGMFLPLYYM